MLPKCTNITWVILVPKIEGAKEVNEFRPTSMVGSVYKVISKILANRLKKAMPKLVGETQSVFVCGRQILDGTLIACEVVNWLRKKEKVKCLVKLDFQKAHDKVS